MISWSNNLLSMLIGVSVLLVGCGKYGEQAAVWSEIRSLGLPEIPGVHRIERSEETNSVRYNILFHSRKRMIYREMIALIIPSMKREGWKWKNDLPESLILDPTGPIPIPVIMTKNKMEIMIVLTPDFASKMPIGDSKVEEIVLSLEW